MPALQVPVYSPVTPPLRHADRWQLITFAMDVSCNFLVSSFVHVVVAEDPASILIDETMNQQWLQLKYTMGSLHVPSSDAVC